MAARVVPMSSTYLELLYRIWVPGEVRRRSGAAAKLAMSWLGVAGFGGQLAADGRPEQLAACQQGRQAIDHGLAAGAT
jgi:hypothetical protein